MTQPAESEQLNVTALIRDAREIMALLGVTAAADVLPELRRLVPQPTGAAPNVARVVQADLLAHARRERDEARADAASYAARLKATDISWTAVARERDEARAEVERLKATYEQAVDARLAEGNGKPGDEAKS